MAKRAVLAFLLTVAGAGCAGPGTGPSLPTPGPVAAFPPPTETAPIKPLPLQPGGTVALVAPASPPDPEAVERVRQGLEGLGFTVKVAANVLERHGYLAGEDDARAAAFMAAWTDPEVDAVFSLAGGYGVNRILPLLDFQDIARNPKVFTGFSDITALHLAIQNHTNLVTFHAPTHSATLGGDAGLRPVQYGWFWRQVYGPSYLDAHGNRLPSGLLLPSGDDLGETRALVPGKAVGRLTGGNLALIASLVGTPYALRPDGALLFLEDVGEEPYRIDRMLSTLELAGVLDQVAGVVLGRFARCEAANPETSLTLDEVFERYFAGRPYPVLLGFPTGHVVDNVTLPYGVLAELDADARTLRLLEDPVRLP
jgi:muramoyltetrapeptide carboxypeptidase